MGMTIVHAGQRVWMLRAKHPLASLHHLHLQLFGLVPSAFVSVRRRQVAYAAEAFLFIVFGRLMVTEGGDTVEFGETAVRTTGGSKSWRFALPQCPVFNVPLSPTSLPQRRWLASPNLPSSNGTAYSLCWSDRLSSLFGTAINSPET